MSYNKRQRKPKGQSRIDIPEKLATLDTQDTGRRQANKKHNTTQKIKKMPNTDPTKKKKPVGEHRNSRKVSSSSL